MTQPAVNFNEQDGGLGVLPSGAGKLYAVVGVCTGGTANVPATYGRNKELIADNTDGPAVEALAHYIERYGRQGLLVKTGVTTAGAAGSVTLTGTGTSVVTATGTPRDDYDVVLKVVNGGTIGTTGITLRTSLDGGRNYSALISLGTANTYAVPASGLTLNFAAGTLVTGDLVTLRTSAPLWNATQLGTALDALKNSSLAYEVVHIVGAIDATAFDTIETKISAINVIGKSVTWIGNCRMPNAGESEATYLAAMTAIFGSKVSTQGALCFGACKMISSVTTGRKYRRPVSFAAAAREASVSEEIDTADVNLGALVGVSIRDDNGNVDEHDESINPGADDARFYTLRTWEGEGGVFVNRPRLFSSEGSDFQLVPHRRVLNLARVALNAYFRRRLNRPVLVSKKTGYILESEAQEMEAGANAALAAVLSKPKASGWTVAINRSDNILSTKTMNVTGRVIPLGYIEAINFDLGFTNPALNVVAV